MHVHHPTSIGDFTNAWPFGVPSVIGVVAEGSLGQQKSAPLALIEQFQPQAAAVPTDRPNRIVRIAATLDTWWARDVGVLSPFDNAPILAIVLRQHAAIFFRFGFSTYLQILITSGAHFAVVRNDQSPLGNVTPFGVPPGNRFLEQLSDF